MILFNLLNLKGVVQSILGYVSGANQKKSYVLAAFLSAISTQFLQAQCPAGYTQTSGPLNSLGYALNTALESNTGASPAGGSGSGHFGIAQLNGLRGGLFDFRAELVGPTIGTTPLPLAWRNFTAGNPVSGGVQIQSNAGVLGGTYIYLQSHDGDNPVTASLENYAKYTILSIWKYSLVYFL